MGLFITYRKPTRPLTGVFYGVRRMKKLAAGTVVELSTTVATDLTGAEALTYEELGCDITSFSLDRSERDQIDVTPICEKDMKQYLDGLRDQDTVSMDAFYVPDGAAGILLETASESKDNYVLRFTKDETVFWTGLVSVQPFGFNGSVGDALKTTLNFKVRETA